jgi:hypothetical protein
VAANFLEQLEGLATEQRGIASDDQHVPAMLAQMRFAHSNRVGGAQLLGLFDPGDAAIVGELVEDFVLAVADDHHDLGAARLVAGLKDIPEHGATADFVQGLGPPAFHPGALACCENDRGNAHA